MPDYIPQSDAEFDVWQENFVQRVDGSLGVNVNALFSAIEAASDAWTTAYSQHNAAQDAAKAATANKDSQRAALTALIRTAANLAKADPTVTEQQRAAAGLPISQGGSGPVPVPTTRPVGNVDTSQRLRHTVHFRDEGATGKAKPAGVAGCQIWVKVGGEAPKTSDECHFLATDTRTPYLAEFDGEDGGQTAHYMLRWVNTRGEAGPWSETIEATISA